jgi:ATP phosphoribosyltransferase
MRIAIPKGRLQDRVLATFAAAGYDIPSAADLRTRKLVFSRAGIEWIFVKDYAPCTSSTARPTP